MLPVTSQTEMFQQNPVPKPEKTSGCNCWSKRKTKHAKKLTRYEISDSVIQVKAKQVLESKDGK